MTVKALKCLEPRYDNHKVLSHLVKSSRKNNNRDHDIDLVAVVDVSVGDHVVIALNVEADFVVVVVIVVQVVGDVGNHGENVHGCGKKGHLGKAYCCCIS